MTFMTNKMLLSFLRHLGAAGVAIILTITGINHISPLDIVKVLQAVQHFTAHQWAMVANALWIAAVMQARFGVEPWVKSYLKKRFPGAMASGLIDEIFGYADKELNVLMPVAAVSTPVPAPVVPVFPPSTSGSISAPHDPSLVVTNEVLPPGTAPATV